MNEQKYECLKLENQICFPLYACSKEILKKYTPLLDSLNLTYTQYITMMVLWENPCMSVKEIGEKLYLDSGTLTPLLKKLEAKGYIKRTRSKADERSIDVTLTKKGEALRDKALSVPGKIEKCVPLTKEETRTLYDLLYKILS